jgi:hypothetical protein
MANLGLLGALAGAGQALTNIGEDLVKRREQALEWARKEAEYQRQRVDKVSDTQTLYAHEDTMQASREQAATDRSTASDQAAAERQQKQQDFELNKLGKQQTFEATQKDKDRAAELEKEKLVKSIEHSNSQDDIKLRQQLENQTTQGVRYGLRYNPATGKRNDTSPYTELLIVRKDGSTVHTGKLILAPQDRTNQDDGSSPY